MSLVRFTVRNAGRAPVRALLTVLAVAITLVAFVLLRTLSAGWTDRIEQTPNNRVVTRHKIGWAGSMPVHYTDAIRQIPGVDLVAGSSWVGMKLPGKDGIFFPSMAVDVREFVDMHYELSAPREQQEAFVQNRHGALVGAELAKELGWKLGDQLHFEGRDTPGAWDLTLSAIATSTRVGFGQRAVWMHWEYFNETLPPNQKDRLSLIAARITNPAQGGRIAKAIDIRFDDGSDPTFSQEDKALNTAIVGRFGAILSAMNVVSLLVLGVVVLILGNTVAMSTRERMREFATLRALGFMPGHLVSFVLAEAAGLGLVGGALGLALGYPLVQGPLSRYLEEEMGVAALHIANSDALAALALGCILGVVAAGLPALRAARLEVARALSHVA